MASNSDIDLFIQSNNAKNTKSSDRYAENILKRHLQKLSVTKPPEKLSPKELDNVLCDLFMNVKKQNGNEYEPDCLSTVHRALQRVLIAKKYRYNILTDKQFERSRLVLSSKRKKLKK